VACATDYDVWHETEADVTADMIIANLLKNVAVSKRIVRAAVSRLPLREIHSIVFGQLVTPGSHYLPREEVEAWFSDDRLVDPTIGMHNGNSWRATAVVTR